jgi:N6-adenosine-specific RNA methylase IME4
MLEEKPKVLLADPPWMLGQTDIRKGARKHYPLMTTERIGEMPVATIMDEDSSCFLWALPGKALEDAMRVLASWGYTYKSQAVWDKYFMSLGGPYFRSTHEVLLYGTRGKPQKWKHHSQRSVLNFPRLGHSVKPAEQFPMIEALLDGPYLELFARRRPSSNGEHGRWLVWGDSIDSDIVIPGYPVPSDRLHRHGEAA